MLLLFQIFSFLWALAVVPLATILLPVALTWSGRAFAVAALCVGVGPLLFALGKDLGRTVWVRTGAVLIVGGIGMFALIVLRVPAQATSTRVARLLTTDATFLSSFSPAHVVPEADQLALGFTLMTVVDRLLTARQATQLRGFTRDVYSELELDPEFRQLPSVLPAMYRGMLSSTVQSDDGFIYIPPTVDRRVPSPVLIFFHGSGGNFKGYLWILSKVADQVGCIVVAPSNGIGTWHSWETERLVEFAVQRARAATSIDESRIHIAGLSNGVVAVCHLLSNGPAVAKTAILISPVFDKAALSHAARTRALAGTTLLVVTATEDDRVPISYVQSSIRELGRAGATITLKEVPGANHFLMFSHRDDLVSELANWLGSTSRTRTN